MKIASYNIMSGGFSSYDYGVALPERLALLQKAVKVLDAEIIGLVDTFRWDEIFGPEDIQNLFGYQYVYCINLNDARLKKSGHNNGLTLMSKIPMSCRTIRIESRDAIEAKLRFKGEELTVFLVYLDDLSEDTRLSQIRKVIKKMHDSAGNVIVMGDLNSLNLKEVGNVKKHLEAFYQNNPAIKNTLTPVIEEMMKGEVVNALEAVGLEDAGEGSSPTVPTRLFPAITERPFLRLDYCFHTPRLKIRNISLRDKSVFQSTSDHLPLLFELKE